VESLSYSVDSRAHEQSAPPAQVFLSVSRLVLVLGFKNLRLSWSVRRSRWNQDFLTIFFTAAAELSRPVLFWPCAPRLTHRFWIRVSYRVLVRASVRLVRGAQGHIDLFFRSAVLLPPVSAR
jgi:hypothetical protein